MYDECIVYKYFKSIEYVNELGSNGWWVLILSIFSFLDVVKNFELWYIRGINLWNKGIIFYFCFGNFEYFYVNDYCFVEYFIYVGLSYWYKFEVVFNCCFN